MFSGCSSLEKLDLSNFNTDKVNNTYSNMFASCYSLNEMKLSDTVKIPITASLPNIGENYTGWAVKGSAAGVISGDDLKAEFNTSDENLGAGTYLRIKQLDISDENFSLAPSSAEYGGSAIAAPAVVYDKKPVDTDLYAASFKNSSGDPVTDIVNAGTYTITVTGLTPYFGTVDKTFTVTPTSFTEVNVPSVNTGLVYNSTAQALVTPKELSDGTVWYSSSEDGEYTKEIPTAAEAGDYTVWYKITANNNNFIDKKPALLGTVTIAKANPEYSVPHNLTAVCGNTLADVKLPHGFDWTDDSTSVGKAGRNTFKATFTPDDKKNYNIIEEIDVTISVFEHHAQINPTCEKEGVTEYWQDGDGNLYSDAKGVNAITKEDTVIEKLGHKFTHFIEWVWDGFNRAVARLFCDNDDEHKTTEEVLSVIDTVDAPTCTEDGYTYHVATIDVAGYTYTTIKIETNDCPGHAWGEPEWSFSDDYSEATATFTCENDPTHTHKITAPTTRKTTEATKHADGNIIYTVTVSFNGNEYKTSTKVIIPKLADTDSSTNSDTDSSNNSDTDSSTNRDTDYSTNSDTDSTTDTHNPPSDTDNSAADTDSASDTDSATNTDSTSDTDSATNTDSTSDTDSATDTDSTPDTDSATDTDSTSDNDSATDTNLTSDTESASDTDSATDTGSPSDTDVETDTDSTSDTDPTSDTDSAVDTDPTSDTDSAADTDNLPTDTADTPDDPDNHDTTGTSDTPDAPKPEPKVIGIRGDANGDGVVDSGDALAILRNSAWLEEFDSNQTLFGDIDGDGMVTSDDALQVLRYSAQLSVNENIGTDVFEGSNT